MGIKKAMAAVMTFGVVVFGSTAASAYDHGRSCETVTTQRVVDAPGRGRDEVVTTTTQVCNTPRHAVAQRPVTRVVTRRPVVAARKAKVVRKRQVARKGKVVRKASARIVGKPVVKRSVAARKPVTTKTVVRKTVVKEPSRPRTVVTKTTTTRKVSKEKVAKRRSNATNR